MKRSSLLASFGVLFTGLAQAEDSVRQLDYLGAVGGQIVPYYDNGYLIYLHRPNRLQVFRPDGQLSFEFELPCPGTGACSATSVAVDSRGNTAVGFGYLTANGKAGGIRLLNPQGQQTRFIQTSLYVPNKLCFDRTGGLWTLGWQRDRLTGEFEEKDDYPVVRKFSADGQVTGRYLARSLWPSKKSNPGGGGRGYWNMYAASDRIGAIIHEAYADNPAEWIEWDLNGNLLSRTVVPGFMSLGRAFTADGRLYARFPTGPSRPFELRVLDTARGTWTVVPANLPEDVEQDGAFLQGADGNDLVYRTGYGNTRLIWARPGQK